MLALDLSGDEMRAVRDALARLDREDPLAFAALFDPVRSRMQVQLRAGELVSTLRRAGLLDGDDDDALVGTRRVRRLGERYYVMELGAGVEFRQDLWPETDALLDALATLSPGRLLDVGTGTGILAVEAAARGHRVVATDIVPSALALARWNAALNGLDGALDLRQGHLLDPVGDERFDAILTAPHYARAQDQLRLEVLHAAPRHLTDDGRLLVATHLEWQRALVGDGEGPIAAVAAILEPLVAAGASATVRPITSASKRGWFWRAIPVGATGPYVSRHRFLVEIRPRGGRLEVSRPEPARAMTRNVVPLSALLRRESAVAAPREAVIETGADVAAIEGLLAQIAAGRVLLDGPLPTRLHDDCRWGARACVSHDLVAPGAAGAILDAAGDVRPCTHGAPYARHDTTLAALLETQRGLAEAAAARRGCAACSAVAVCSRCLHPASLDESAYCALIRRQAARLPSLVRLFDTLEHLARNGVVDGPLVLKLAPGTPLLAARSPFGEPRDAPAGLAEAVRALARAWRARDAWLVEHRGRFALYWCLGRHRLGDALDGSTAAIAELAAEGHDAPTIAGWAHAHGIPPSMLRRSIAQVSELLLATEVQPAGEATA